MLKFIFAFLISTFILNVDIVAQSTEIPYATFTTEKNRTKEYRNLVNSINKNLSYDLSDSTEENWQNAFYALELLNYHSPWIDNRIRLAFVSIEKRSYSFQRAFLELIYANYKAVFIKQITTFLKQTKHPKLLAMCAEYLFLHSGKEKNAALISKKIEELTSDTAVLNPEPFFTILQNKLGAGKIQRPALHDLLSSSFLKDEIILFSFQRKNRNYPGIAMVREKDGRFTKDQTGNYFSVPQLARSMSNMPGYLTNGNTPQGIFRMTGLAISKSNFIGPTTNIQMIMPFEIPEGEPDSVSEIFAKNYATLLPVSWQKYEPAYEVYFAGLAGRTEIIAHGTTVNPDYYSNQPYFPISPTQGCLCTKEIWSSADGRRIESDQQNLIDALVLAGGAKGYCVVIELDDQQKPVSLKELLTLIKQ